MEVGSSGPAIALGSCLGALPSRYEAFKHRRLRSAESLSVPDPAVETLDLATAFDRAVAAEQAGRFAEAAKLYHAILKVRPVPEVFLNLGLMLDTHGRHAEAEKIYRAALVA